MMGLGCCMQALSSCSKQVLIFAVRWLLTVVALLGGAQALEHSLSSCGTWA